ncbi:MAG: CBS domain-containing protein [Spirochaetales bacterium]|nr:CBS domain-containing protein [Spirochaetales bacterium]
MKVSQRMTINPITVTPEDNIYSVKDIMDREGIHRLPVLDSKGTLVGLISKSDILAASPDFSSSPSIHEVAYLLSRLTVSDVMSTEVMTISPDATVEQAARVMIDGEISCLPVIDNGVLVGLITRTDLFRLLIELLGARHYGVSASFTVKDEPGKLAEITSKLASCEADIVSIGTMRSFSDVGSVTMKVQGISCEDLSDILTPMVIEVQDIREE